MHGTGDREFVLFDRFQRYVETVKKVDEKVLQLFHFSIQWLKSTGLVSSGRNNTTVSNFFLLLVIYYGFLAKKWVKILIVPSFRLKFDDVTVTWSLIVLSLAFLINLI